MWTRTTYPSAALTGVILLAAMTFASETSGQSRWAMPQDGSVLRLEVLKPFLDGEDRTTFGTTATTISGQARIGKVLLQAELPIAHVGIEDSDISETDMGNPYVGILHRFEGGGLVQGGVRFPLAGDGGGTAAGLLADFDHLEAYVPDLWTITAGGGYEAKFDGGFRVDGGVGASVLIPTEEGGDTEFTLDYRLRGLFEQGAVRFGAGLSGRFLATAEEGEGLIGDSKTEHHLGLTLAYLAGSVEPHVHLRIPIAGDLKDAVNLSLGLGLTMRLGR